MLAAVDLHVPLPGLPWLLALKYLINSVFEGVFELGNFLPFLQRLVQDFGLDVSNLAPAEQRVQTALLGPAVELVGEATISANLAWVNEQAELGLLQDLFVGVELGGHGFKLGLLAVLERFLLFNLLFLERPLVDPLLVLYQILHLEVVVHYFLVPRGQRHVVWSVHDVFVVKQVVIMFESVLQGGYLVHVIRVLADGLDAIAGHEQTVQELVDVVINQIVLEDCREQLPCVLLDVFAVAFVRHFLAVGPDLVLRHTLVEQRVVEQDIVDVLHVVKVVFYRKLSADQLLQLELLQSQQRQHKRRKLAFSL